MRIRSIFCNLSYHIFDSTTFSMLMSGQHTASVGNILSIHKPTPNHSGKKKNIKTSPALGNFLVESGSPVFLGPGDVRKHHQLFPFFGV